MTQRQVSNISASVRQRLLNRARQSNRPFNELLQYYAMERFLYRLSRSAHACKFVLKGALMFAAWQAPATRPTMDIDLLGIADNSLEVIEAYMRDVCMQEVDPDGFIFYEDTVIAERIVEDADYAGVRVRLRGSLDTARVAMQIDIGFGDVVVPGSEMTEYPTMLDFPAPRLRGYSRESAVAEKFEAMVKLGEINSRVKDFFDIWLLARQFDFTGETIAKAVEKTFANRGTRIIAAPVALTNEYAMEPARQTRWQGFVRMNRLLDAPESFVDIVEANEVFLGPVARALSAGKAFRGVWRAPGPWQRVS